MSTKCPWVQWLRAPPPESSTSQLRFKSSVAACSQQLPPVMNRAPPGPSQAVEKRVRQTRFQKWGEDLVGFTHLLNEVTHLDKQLPSNHRRREERESNKPGTPVHSGASETLLWPEAASLVHPLCLFLPVSLCAA